MLRLPRRVISVFCRQCTSFLLTYYKGGSGGLVKCFLERIKKDHTSLPGVCPGCSTVFAREAVIRHKRALKIEGESTGGLRAGIAAADSGLAEVQGKIDRLYSRKQSLQKEKEKLLVEARHLEQACSQPDVNLRRSDFEWSDRIQHLRSSRFGIETFRPYQEEVINATMSGRDVILVMPTGGGKSLCFQLPALLSKGFTLVVSPLVSLMEDQTMTLQASGVPATLLSAAASREHVKTVHADMVRPDADLKLLYVTPEKIVKSKRFMAQLQKAYEKGHLARIAIDEVHCCSQWGHDFRPDYKVLGILKRQFPRSPILGLTATASSSVLEDVKSILNIPGCDVFRASYNRANLYYEVRPKPVGKEFVNTLERMLKGEFANQSGIIYCFSRKDTETLAAELMDRGILAAAYHAHVEPGTRSQIHRNWKNGHIQVVIATTAFGMGIDKPDVRFVVHHSLSKSMENYYQESGRAGRNDEPAKCILYFGFVDVFRQSTMVVMEQTGLTKLYQMVAYCISTGRCRRSLLGEHFDEATWDGGVECNRMCDACRSGESAEDLDVTGITKKILQIIWESGSKDQRLTGLKVIDLLAKSQNMKSSKKLSKLDYGHIILHLLLEGYLKEDFHFTAYSTISYLCAGPKAEHAHSGSKVTVPMKSAGGRTKSRGNEKANGCDTRLKPLMSPPSKKKDEIIVLDDDSDDDDDDGRSGCAGNEETKGGGNSRGCRKKTEVRAQRSQPRTEAHETCVEYHDQSDGSKKATGMDKRSKVIAKVRKKGTGDGGGKTMGHSSKSKETGLKQRLKGDERKSPTSQTAESVATGRAKKMRKPESLNMGKEHLDSGAKLAKGTPKQKRKLEDDSLERTSPKRSKQSSTGNNSFIGTALSVESQVSWTGDGRGDLEVHVMGAKNVTKKNLSRKKRPGVDKSGTKEEKQKCGDRLGSRVPTKRQTGKRTEKDEAPPKRGELVQSGGREGNNKAVPVRGVVSHLDTPDRGNSADRMDRSDVSDAVDIAAVYMDQLSSLEHVEDSDEGSPLNQKAASRKRKVVNGNPTTSAYNKNAASALSPASDSDRDRVVKPRKTAHKHLSLDGCPNPSESSTDEDGLENDGQDRDVPCLSGEGTPGDDSELEELATVYSEQLSSLGE